MKKRLQGFLTLVLVLALLSSPGVLLAGEPTDQLSATITAIIDTLNDSALKGEANEGKRKEILKNQIRERFSFREMAKRSLGKHWKNRSDEEAKEFTEIFAKLIFNSYISKLERFAGEKVLYTKERVVKNKAAIVKTQIITEDKEIPVTYKMFINDSGNWRVYDVSVEGVSLVSNYRAQFNKVISSESYDKLVTMLKEKSGQTS